MTTFSVPSTLPLPRRRHTPLPPSSSFRRSTASPQLGSRTTFVSDALHISASVLPRIFPSVLFVTVYATVIAIADLWYDRSWKTTNSIIGPLSVVVGLLVVFRNGTSYDRWYEGRKVWQDASATVRNLAVLVWCNVDPDGNGKEGEDDERRKRREERKKRAIRLLVAFMVAVKHHLRGEYGGHWEDLEGLLPQDWRVSTRDGGVEGGGSKRTSFLSRQSGEATAAAIASASVSADDDDEQPAANADNGRKGDIESLGERSPLLSRSASSCSTAAAAASETDLPTQILTTLHVYVAGLQRSSLLPSPPFHGVLVTNLTTLSLHFSSLSRISTTTIPQVYSIHLKQSCLLYLLALPLTLVGELSWRMIPFVTLVAITLMGLEGISSEIEDPFGHDKSDHPLDDWCEELRRDVERMLVEVEEESEEE
ncbi:hypothetical protein ACQY0O_003726 [Thecaphora frezii]